MFDIAPTEMLLVAVVALVVIGPKDLPRVMRVVGGWVGRARGMARHFRSGIDEMIRQSELQEMEARWAAENERIMREHPPVATPAPTPAEDSIAAQEADAGAIPPSPEPVDEAATQHMLPLPPASHPAADKPA